MPVNFLLLFFFPFRVLLKKFALSLVIVQIYIFCCALSVCGVLCPPCAYIGLCLLLWFECYIYSM